MSFDPRPQPWELQAPCVGQPGFERNDGDDEWPNTPEAQRAITICRSCPFLRTHCPAKALSAGTGYDEVAVIPASDVIAASIVCTGDRMTTRALKAVMDGATYMQRKPRPTHCVRCAKPLRANYTDATPGTVRHAGHGVCVTCRQAEKRQEEKAAA